MKKNIFCFLLCFLSIGSLIAQVPSYVPTSGLVGWWPFNGNALDISGNANNGTVNGATLTTDRFGNTNKAFSFDGIADYIDCGNSSSVNILGDITISAWIYANNFNTDHGIVSKSGLYDFITNSDQSIPPLDKLRWTAGGNTPTIFTNAISGNQWLHVVAIYSSVSGKSVYLNGNLFASNTQTGVTQPNTNYRLYLGAHQPFAVDYWSWNGKLDDIGLWNRALTQQEVTNLYLSTTVSSSRLGQSKVKLVVNVEEDIYKTVTNKKEIAEMGDGGHFEKFYKKQKMKLGSSFNVDRAHFLNAIISGNNDTVSFKIIEKSTGNIVYNLDSIVVNGNYEIPGSDLNEAISAHTVYDSGECSTWDEIYNCDLIIQIVKNNKIIIKKQFNIYPIIG